MSFISNAVPDPLIIASCKKPQTVSDKVGSVGENINEIKSLANEISSKIYGSSTAKISNDCGNVPVDNCIDNLLNIINGDTVDIKNMLRDILNSL